MKKSSKILIESRIEKYKEIGMNLGFTPADIDNAIKNAMEKFNSRGLSKVSFLDILQGETNKLVSSRNCQLTQIWY